MTLYWMSQPCHCPFTSIVSRDHAKPSRIDLKLSVSSTLRSPFWFTSRCLRMARVQFYSSLCLFSLFLSKDKRTITLLAAGGVSSDKADAFIEFSSSSATDIECLLMSWCRLTVSKASFESLVSFGLMCYEPVGLVLYCLILKTYLFM